MSWLTEVFGTPRPLIGVVHLRPLPGSPRYEGDLEEVLRHARRSALALKEAGFHGIVLENYGDVPFFPETVPPHVACLAAVLVKEFSELLPCGINLLRNAASQALAAAFAGGGSFIRVNVHVGAVVADQGLLAGKAHETLRYRSQIGARVRILADIAVKHAQALVARDPLQEALDCVERGLADGLIVTGPRTGTPADLSLAKRLREALPRIPIFAGSGVTAATVRETIKVVDGIIVGTALENEPGVIDPQKARAFVKAVGAHEA